MHETINPVKRILRILLYAGAGFCCLAGLRVIYVLITDFTTTDQILPIELTLAVVFVCLAFAPAFMLLMGLKTRTWHRALILIAETIVVTLVLSYTVADYVYD
jgi:hypothetical protein